MAGQHIPKPKRQLFMETDMKNSEESSLPCTTLVDLRDKVSCLLHSHSLER